MTKINLLLAENSKYSHIIMHKHWPVFVHDNMRKFGIFRPHKIYFCYFEIVNFWKFQLPPQAEKLKNTVKIFTFQNLWHIWVYRATNWKNSKNFSRRHILDLKRREESEKLIKNEIFPVPGVDLDPFIGPLPLRRRWVKDDKNYDIKLLN